MFVLYFKNQLTDEQDRILFNYLQKFIISCDFLCDQVFFMKISVYTDNAEDEEEIVQYLQVQQNLQFSIERAVDVPIFHESLNDDSYNGLDFETSNISPIHTISPKPNIEKVPMLLKRCLSPVPVVQNDKSQKEIQELKAMLADIQLKSANGLNDLRLEIMKNFSEVIKSQQSVAQPNIQQQQLQQGPPPPRLQLVHPAVSQNQKQQFKAKNELISNGIKCEICKETIRSETINTFLDDIRVHALIHFDTAYPHFKRFACKECTGISTNFVKEIEKHLGKHATFVPLPQKRATLVNHLMSPEYLKYLAAASSQSFPEVFENIPKDVSMIAQHSPPQKALREVFPFIKREFCNKHNVSDERMMRARNPNVNIPVVNL